jgi:hypothetical protein
MAELIHSGCKTVLSETSKHVNSVWYKGELTNQLKESIVLYIYLRRVMKLVVINY